VPTLLIFDGGVPVEFIVGIVPELVRKALGGGTESQKAGEIYLSGQRLEKGEGEFP
jgi:hypothetical protein